MLFDVFVFEQFAGVKSNASQDFSSLCLEFGHVYLKDFLFKGILNKLLACVTCTFPLKDFIISSVKRRRIIARLTFHEEILFLNLSFQILRIPRDLDMFLRKV